MIIIYVLDEHGKIKRIEGPSLEDIKRALWVDLIDPPEKEERYLEQVLRVDIPSREEMDKNEVLSPFYNKGSVRYMTMTAVSDKSADYFRSTAVTFIFIPNQSLITIRYSKPKVFSYFANQLTNELSERPYSPEFILEELIALFINNIADVLEKTGNDLDKILFNLFNRPNLTIKNKKTPGISAQYDEILKEVGKNTNVISKNLESLVSINRMLMFLGQSPKNKNIISKHVLEKFKILSHEIQSLTEYANFLSQRNSFLLDALLGILNIKQNTIIKVFTVAAAMFMPPTLIASIYGMNFKFMPEIEWEFGYPFSMFLMALSALIPYLVFKKKGWL